jgi:tetratricopeptide (TPR) repeat protein
MKSLINELHRRSLWQVLGIYLAGSWIALQVVDVVNQNFGLPDWVAPFALILLVIGLPIVLATAFVQEGMKPGSARAEAAAAAPAASAVASEKSTGSVQEAAPAREPGGTQHRLFTWRNAIVGGVLAFAVLGVGTIGYMAMRTAGIGPAATLVARGVFDERAPVILADFESPGTDSLLARAATEALRVDLGQSQVVTIVEPTQVATVLRRMDRPTDIHLGLDLAREVAQREGAQAVIAGEIIPAGQGFVLSARVVTAADGEELVSHRETAAGAEEIIPAIDKLSNRLRERIGESLRTLSSDEPLASVSTHSLEALRKYSEAMYAVEVLGDDERGMALLEESVALDTAFAMAWRKLGTVLQNRGQERSRALEALSNAYKYRDRLTELERYWAMGSYYTFVDHQPEEAITAYRNLLELQPGDSRALNNLGNRYREVRDVPRALEAYQLGIAADSTNSLVASNYALQLYIAGRTEEALQLAEASTARFAGNPSTAQNAALLYAAEGDFASARQFNEVAVDAGASSLYWRAQGDDQLAMLAAVEGRLSAADDHFQRRLATEEETGLPAAPINAAIAHANLEIHMRGNVEAAVVTVERALARHPLSEMDPYDRPYVSLGIFFVDAGQIDRARALRDELESEIDVNRLGAGESIFLDVFRGRLAQAAGREGEALEFYRAADRSWCYACGLREIADLHDAAGRPDSATAYYEQSLEVPAPFRMYGDYSLLGPILERTAQLFDEQGDLEKAAEYYARFVELWANADEELQPRVQAAQARLEEIVRERG